MPEPQEVFRMATQKVRPDPGFVDRQYDHRRKQERKRKIGAFAVVAAIGAVVAVLVVRSVPGDRQGQPAVSAPSVAVPGVPAVDSALEPKVDYMVDLSTGKKTLLPKAIIRSLGETAEGKGAESRYAASPDGSRLAYVGTGDKGSPQIFIAGIDGTGVRQVTHDPRGAMSPAWSPDGTKIAYVGGSGDVRNLFVLESPRARRQDRRRGPWGGLQFTPDGSSLVYTGRSDMSR